MSLHKPTVLPSVDMGLHALLFSNLPCAHTHHHDHRTHPTPMTPPLPFVWFAVHGHCPDGRAGPPPGPTSPRCIMLGENRGSEDRWGHPEEWAGVHPRHPTSLNANGTARRWIKVARTRPFPMHTVIEKVLGDGHGVHYLEQEAHADALSYLLDEIEESPVFSFTSPPLPGMQPAKKALRLHLWLRDGLAWTNPFHPVATPAFPNLDGLMGHPLAEMAANRFDGPLPPATPFGLVLIDHAFEGNPSAHHILESERRVLEDLSLAHAWIESQGHSGRRPMLVRA